MVRIILLRKVWVIQSISLRLVLVHRKFLILIFGSFFSFCWLGCLLWRLLLSLFWCAYSWTFNNSGQRSICNSMERWEPSCWRSYSYSRLMVNSNSRRLLMYNRDIFCDFFRYRNLNDFFNCLILSISNLHRFITLIFFIITAHVLLYPYFMSFIVLS